MLGKRAPPIADKATAVSIGSTKKVSIQAKKTRRAAARELKMAQPAKYCPPQAKKESAKAKNSPIAKISKYITLIVVAIISSNRITAVSISNSLSMNLLPRFALKI